MQTFLPLPSFVYSARCLDDKRLGKQRLEARQILRTLLGQSAGWANHPAVRMWRGYAPALASYGLAVCQEWRDGRGFRDSMADEFLATASVSLELPPWLVREEFADQFLAAASVSLELPPWFGREDFHASHRSNLLRKDPEHYGRFGWTEGPDLPYYWPVTG